MANAKRVLPLLLSFLFLLSNCSGGEKAPSGPRLLKPIELILPNSTPIVFVPGYKGSELISSKGKVWLSPSQALAFSSPDLILRESDEIKPGDVLRSVTAIPVLLDVKVYAPWLDRMISEKQWIPYVFPYDWRKDNGDTSSQLELYLTRIKESSGGKSPIVIGHSNGGTLTLSVLNRRPDLISKAVFVGAPFRSGIGFMEDLSLDQSTGLNGKIMGPCVASSFISVYTFFPRESSFDTKDVLQNKNGESLPTRFFQAWFWKEHELGAYSKTASCSPLPNLSEFQTRLDKAKSFRNSLSPKKGTKYPPTLVIRATNHPTLRVLLGSKDAQGWNWDFHASKRVNGDGRVTAESALPPDGLPYELFESELGHSELLNDPKVQSKILEFSGLK
ncbi:lecithin:cholesterol acyltransferase domain protein [Leptospira fainei serovar Hurstbridge str. BUT 6]|uniref:Lecithin:cholesterol acyltransferase domain protein n=1 Tax=Leptospira fainei serovar Hurstbridge str. BUT 6 TaxID=1193011 RepID=S3V3A4_9LEPT|nr:lecithin--cholesterol acyltransferase [Leptospira fainei]EPG75109.1 lecithin:cholesterol acyltransferase domain protein [Leptospira fainei serovar Hurstbridge str. BUT 6]